MEPVTARKMWRTLEPYHVIVYFASELREECEALGLTGRPMIYTATRAAAMGTVSPEVVVATFYNFHPRMIVEAVEEAWQRTSPREAVEARRRGADRALRRVLGDAVEGEDMVEAAGLAREAAVGCTVPGRPLYAGHAALDWPEPPHLALWHAITLLREFRGDGHVASLLAEDVGGLEALLLHAASEEAAADFLKATRMWPTEAWDAAAAGLRGRGLLDASGGLTDAGARLRESIEARTDRLALAPWQRLGQERCDRLRALVRPWSRAIVDSGALPG